MLLWNVTFPQAQLPLRTEGGGGAVEFEVGSISIIYSVSGKLAMEYLMTMIPQRKRNEFTYVRLSFRDRPAHTEYLGEGKPFRLALMIPLLDR